LTVEHGGFRYLQKPVENAQRAARRLLGAAGQFLASLGSALDRRRLRGTIELQLEPETVKLDMSLVRGIDGSSAKSSLVRSIVHPYRHGLEVRVVCEGVETVAERDTLERLGAELLQGYLFAKPEPRFRRQSIFAGPEPAAVDH